MAQSLFDKYGGQQRVAAVVRDFYVRVMADSALQPYFEGVHLERLIQHQTNLVAKALGGPEPYRGRDVRRAHAGHGIDDDAFDRTAHHLGEALNNAGFSAEDRTAVLEFVEELRSAVVTRLRDSRNG